MFTSQVIRLLPLLAFEFILRDPEVLNKADFLDVTVSYSTLIEVF